MILVDRSNIYIITFNLLFSLLLFSCNSSGLEEFIIEGPTMGTQYKIVIKSDQDIETNVILNEVELILDDINNQMSTYIPDSYISNFNKAKLKGWGSRDSIPIPDHFLNVIEKSFYYFELSNGVFDITIQPLYDLWGFQNKNLLNDEPSKEDIQKILTHTGMNKLEFNQVQEKIWSNYPSLSLDVSALAKGYAVDLISEYFEDQKLFDYFIDIGGEIRVSSTGGKSWDIGIQEPDLNKLGEVNKAIRLSNNSIATSGNYANFIEYIDSGVTRTHIINPKTGYPLEIKDGVISSASVIAPLCMDADALATTLMLLDKDEGLKLIESLDNTEAYLIYYKSGKLHTVESLGFRQYLYE